MPISRSIRPTTPISPRACRRGRSAIPARRRCTTRCSPEQSDDLYFVADGTGGHVFAKTLAEQNRNVATYLHGAAAAEAEPAPANPPPPPVRAAGKQASRSAAALPGEPRPSLRRALRRSRMGVSSMTGFARAEGEAAGISWVWELKSVNGRSLDLRLRLPPGYDALEAPLRAALGGRLRRGNISANLTVNRVAPPAIRINREMLSAGAGPDRRAGRARSRPRRRGSTG